MPYVFTGSVIGTLLARHLAAQYYPQVAKRPWPLQSQTLQFCMLIVAWHFTFFHIWHVCNSTVAEYPELFHAPLVLYAIADGTDGDVFDLFLGSSVAAVGLWGARWDSKRLRGTMSLWAVFVACQSSCHAYNILYDQPHNGDRFILLVLGFAVFWRPAALCILTPYAIIMNGQFVLGEEIAAATAGVVWTVLVGGACALALNVSTPPTTSLLLVLAMMQYVAPAINKYNSDWHTNEPRLWLLHLQAKWAYQYQQTWFLGRLRNFTNLVEHWNRFLVYSVIILEGPISLASLLSRWVAIVALLAHATFHVAILATGHTHYGHLLVMAAIAWLLLSTGVVNRVAMIVAVVLMHAPALATVWPQISVPWLVDNPLAVEAGNVFSNMAFEPSRGAYRWALHVDGDGFRGPLHPLLFGPFSYEVVRADLYFLNPLLVETPWMSLGECGFHHYAESIDKVAQAECPRVDGERLPICWSRCFSRLVPPLTENDDSDSKLQSFERLIVAAFQPKRNLERLWRPFRLLDSLLGMRMLPLGDHWCCSGDQWLWPENLTAIRAVTVRLTEAVLCPDGSHKVGFDGAVYSAVLTADGELHRQEVPNDLLHETEQCQVLSR